MQSRITTGELVSDSSDIFSGYRYVQLRGGDSRKKYCGWCSQNFSKAAGDAARWYRLQVVEVGISDEVKAGISVEAAGGQQRRYFRRIDECSCVVAVAAQDAADETSVGGGCMCRRRLR